MVVVEQVRYAYGCGKAALEGVSFALRAGERVGLVGPNGAGKSTLLLHLNGLLPGCHSGGGRIMIGGVTVAPPHLCEIRRRVGVLFQDSDDQLFCTTVADDVAFGPRQLFPDEDDAAVAARVARALAATGAAELGGRPPHQISRGQKRRVALAGVLACEPDVLVLDEPTSDLDPRGRHELLELLQRLPQTQLVASHDLPFVRRLCSRVLVIDGGRLMADGPTEAIFADRELMTRHGLVWD